MGDPYARMLEVLRGESSEASKTGETTHAGLGARPAKMRLGTVSQRKPLKVKVMGIEQPTECLRINERLVKGAKWCTIERFCESSESITEVEQAEIDLNVDDQVLLLTEDDQIFYILMRVVKAV